MLWHDVAGSQDGVVSRSQLFDAGVGNGYIENLLERGLLTRPAYGVYLVGGAPLTYRARLWCAVLSTRGTLAFHTAAELWGFSERPDEVIHVLMPHERRVVPPPNVQVHRRRRCGDVCEVVGGLPMTSRSDTVLDQLGILPARLATMLADRAVQRAWIRPEEVSARLRDFPGRPGNGQLRRIAARLGDGAASMAERRLHRILQSSGLGEWVPNHQVWLDGVLIAVVDIAFPSLRIAIEVDGMAYHVDPDRFQRDRRRQNSLVDLGWTVLRFTWADLVEQPRYVAASIRRVTQRGESLAAPSD